MARYVVEESDSAEATDKGPVMTTVGDVNMLWFVNYILMKRISNQNISFVNIYIDLVYTIGEKQVAVSLTVKQAVGIFKRFMLIDEEQFLKVANRVQGLPSSNSSLLKPYL